MAINETPKKGNTRMITACHKYIDFISFVKMQMC